MQHDELFETIASPDLIYEGSNGEAIAVKEFKNITDKFVAVIYKEVGFEDGLVITYFISSKKQQFEKRKIIWKRTLK